MSQQAEHEEIKKKVLSTGIRVGTEVKTKFMIPYIIQANPEGLYLFDLDITLSRIRTAARFIKKFDIEKVIVYSGRVYATTPIEKFCELTGAKKMLGRFMPGTLTNPSLPYYSEPLLIIISDPQVDAQAVTEATNAGIPVIGIANTDNVTSKLDLVIPANNRGRKALATVYWLLAREILQDSKTMKYEIEDFETKTAEVEEEL
ncbi:30S ribosomal protein S2 [Marine Group I thaumarchaeote]|nr:30S ribosomal protein S2 [Marine Group I thaumarchaeote]